MDGVSNLALAAQTLSQNLQAQQVEDVQDDATIESLKVIGGGGALIGGGGGGGGGGAWDLLTTTEQFDDSWTPRVPLLLSLLLGYYNDL